MTPINQRITGRGNLFCTFGFHAPHIVEFDGRTWRECRRCTQLMSGVYPSKLVREAIAAEEEKERRLDAMRAAKTKARP